MTLGELKEICGRNGVPDDAALLSDSGWECCETPMDAIWYSDGINAIVFTQGGDFEDSYDADGKYGTAIPRGTEFRRLQ